MTIERIPIDTGSPEGRAQWLALRDKDITASMAATLLGVHPYITPFSAFLLKSGKISDDPEESPALRRGRLLEPVAIQMLREDYPNWIDTASPNAYYRDPEIRLGATPDVTAFDPQRGLGVVQIKTVEPSIFRKQWRDESGEVSPPLWIAVQALIEAHLTGAQWAAVAPMVVSFGIDMPLIEIPLHAGVIDRIKAEVVAFWDRIARNDPYEPDYTRDGEALAKLYGAADGSTVDLRHDNELPTLAAEDQVLATEIRERKARRDEIRAAILAKIGSASRAIFQGGVITAPTITRKAYSVAAASYRNISIKMQEAGT
jgi:predicted phage-related endonuclease